MSKNLISFDDYINNRIATNESDFSFGDPTIRDVDVKELKSMLEKSLEAKQRGNRLKPILICGVKELGPMEVVEKTAQDLGVSFLPVDLTGVVFVQPEDILSKPRVVANEKPVYVFPEDNGPNGRGGFIFIGDLISTMESNEYLVQGWIREFILTGKAGFRKRLPDKWFIVASEYNIRDLDPETKEGFDVVNLVRGYEIFD